MDISGRILREVEFRDRLRGYDTEEVDDFLEKLAVAVDGLQAELEAARSAPQPQRDPVDDESLRRTLVLAQRTADLAIKEARDEASSLLEDARTQSDSLVTTARDEARRLRETAETETHTKLSELEARRTAIEAEVDALVAFVEEERRRLIGGLNAALSAVTSSITVPAVPGPHPESPPPTGRGELAPHHPSDPEPEHSDGGPPTQLVETAALDDEGDDDGEDDDEPSQLELGEGDDDADDEVKASAADDGANPLSVTGEAALAEIEAVVDPDEALWQRWAKGADLDATPESKSRVLRSSNRNERRGRDWSA